MYQEWIMFFLWWRLCNPVCPEEHYIQQLAIKILFITPHNAGCECVFFIISWMANKRRTQLNVEKLESMAKLHTHYITNAKSELKFAYNTLSEDQFQNEVQETFSNPSFFDDDDVERNGCLDLREKETPGNGLETSENSYG
ncbi:hypothetical protein C1646_672198 [Rhizophagus diaphanus]|nr:hypothetical protein C1646_672198 [Rhizophagus diaphanus] [Rhizophagus sp. MUCL 43196]